jgi:hypothetical protein
MPGFPRSHNPSLPLNDKVQLPSHDISNMRSIGRFLWAHLGHDMVLLHLAYNRPIFFFAVCDGKLTCGTF